MFGSMGGGLDSDEVSRDHGCLPLAGGGGGGAGGGGC